MFYELESAGCNQLFECPLVWTMNMKKVMDGNLIGEGGGINVMP